MSKELDGMKMRVCRREHIDPAQGRPTSSFDGQMEVCMCSEEEEELREVLIGCE